MTWPYAPEPALHGRTAGFAYNITGVTKPVDGFAAADRLPPS